MPTVGAQKTVKWPVVDLGQKHAFNPADTEQWLSYLLIAAGWILATTIAASVARIITRR